MRENQIMSKIGVIDKKTHMKCLNYGKCKCTLTQDAADEMVTTKQSTTASSLFQSKSPVKIRSEKIFRSPKRSTQIELKEEDIKLAFAKS